MAMTGKKTLLLVDDTSTVRMLERAILGADYDYLEAKNGADAIAVATERLPDLILMDLNMPVKDGLRGLQELKAQPQTQHIPVIIITSENEPTKRERCLSLGCAEFLTKPLDRLRLRESVRRHLLG
jgi:CheY-like chemotaxis protein